MTWGILSIIIFNLTDTFFVARLGTIPLAALSFTFPVVITIASFALGLGTGASSVISRAIGRGDPEQVKRLTTDSLSLALLCVGCLIVIGLLTIKPLFSLLGAQDQALKLVTQYMQIWYVGMIFVVIPMVGNNALRASGDTLNPAIIMSISAAINIILDPILIFGLVGFPALGIRGAAIATVVARATSMTLSLTILHFRKRMLTFSIPTLQKLLDSYKQILHVGLPAAATNAITPVSTGIVTAMIAAFGAPAVAAFGLATRIESFSLVVLYALSASIAPFIGQNWGAKLYPRVNRALKVSFVFSIIYGLCLAILLAIFAKPLVKLFVDNTDVLTHAAAFLLIVPVSYGLSGIILIASSAFNATAKPLSSAALILTKSIILYIPLAFVGKTLFGVNGIFAALALTNIITGLAALVWNRKYYTRTLLPKKTE